MFIKLGSSTVNKTIKHAETADIRQGRSLPPYDIQDPDRYIRIRFMGPEHP